MNIKTGDFVKGITNDYGITNTKMTRGVVTDVRDESIVVRVLDHDAGNTGIFTVNPEKFEVIGHQKQFDRAEVLKFLKDGCKKAILDYDLRGADLSDASLDYSCYPLCSMQCDDADYIKMRNSILGFANQFHRVDECGELEESEI